MNSTASTVTATSALSSKPIGLLAKAYCNKHLPLTVLQSARGFYIGTASEDGPCSRESVQYWPSQDAADQALATGMWTQRSEP